MFLLPTGLFRCNKEGNTLLVASKIHLKRSAAPSLAWNTRRRDRLSSTHPSLHHISTHCPPHPPSIETMPIWARFWRSASVHHLPTRRATKKCPSGHGFDARCLSTVPNIETMPIWAHFRCLVSVHHFLTCEHWKNAQMGMVSMLGVCQLSRTSKLCPFGHIFDVQVVHHFPIPRTSKPCPSGHGFDPWRVSTTSLSTEHRKNAQMDMVSMFGICVPPGTSKLCPPRHVFDAQRVSTTSLPAEHRNYAHLGMFSMLSTCSLHLYQSHAQMHMSRCSPLKRYNAAFEVFTVPHVNPLDS